MEQYVGLDVSMKETHICVVDFDGNVVILWENWGQVFHFGILDYTNMLK